MAGAIAHHDGVTIWKRLEPEENAADDVARFPDEKMVGGHGFELVARRQDRRLDAARVAQALQDQLIGGGGFLLALLDLCEIAIEKTARSARAVSTFASRWAILTVAERVSPPGPRGPVPRAQVPARGPGPVPVPRLRAPESRPAVPVFPLPAARQSP
jgi:hypothetical protein